MCQRPVSTLGTWVLTHPPPLCWTTVWWREHSLYCRNVCRDNPPTCDARDWTTSHNLCHYHHHQTHTDSDDQVSWRYPLQWTITSEPVQNPTDRASSRARPRQPTVSNTLSVRLSLRMRPTMIFHIKSTISKTPVSKRSFSQRKWKCVGLGQMETWRISRQPCFQQRDMGLEAWKQGLLTWRRVRMSWCRDVTWSVVEKCEYKKERHREMKGLKEENEN